VPQLDDRCCRSASICACRLADPAHSRWAALAQLGDDLGAWACAAARIAASPCASSGARAALREHLAASRWASSAGDALLDRRRAFGVDLLKPRTTRRATAK
jgi:hypothetical protein